MDTGTKVCQDRNGKPVCIGDRVRIKHCVGRYGQTNVTEGILTYADRYGGVSLTLAAPYRDVSNNTVRYLKSGEELYIAGGTRCGKHADFEHAHEFWIEKL